MTAQGAAPTRQRLLQAGQAEIYLHGFHGASLGAILQRAQATKGAFFHYFASKKAFGYAIVEEVLAQMITAQWVTPLDASHDPLETISAEFERGMAFLATHGFSDRDAMLGMITVFDYALGVTYEHQADARITADPPTPGAAVFAPLAGLSRDDGRDDLFEGGLDLILDGLALRCK